MDVTSGQMKVRVAMTVQYSEPKLMVLNHDVVVTVRETVFNMGCYDVTDLTDGIQTEQNLEFISQVGHRSCRRWSSRCIVNAALRDRKIVVHAVLLK